MILEHTVAIWHINNKKWLSMKKSILISLFFLFQHSICNAGDFIVEYVEENYRETSSPVSYSPVIYHSIQVTSDAGPKVLVLKGDDEHYRKWLRQFIAQGKQFIAQISDDQDDLFISSSAFEMNVADLHPFNLRLYRQGENKSKTRKKDGPDNKDSDTGQFPGSVQPTKKIETNKSPVGLKKKKNKTGRHKKRAALKEKNKKKIKSPQNTGT